MIVADKPAGLLSVTGRGPEGEDCLHARLCLQWPDALVVHRLDMATSGLMVFARGPAAQRHLSRCFAERVVDKRYVAIVAGRPLAQAPDAEGWSSIAWPLGADWPARPRQKVDLEAGKPSLTHWRAQGDASSAWGEATRLDLHPVTGRSHQLRVHLSALGHPILGDLLYAPPDWAGASDRLLLHARRLALPHPAHGQWRAWESPAPF